MDIALLNVNIIFQKNESQADAIGNHKNTWTDYYTCHATVSSEGGYEKRTAGMVVEDFDIAFTIRYCQKAVIINALQYRILFNDEIYNIVSIDHMNYKKESIKFRCRKVRR